MPRHGTLCIVVHNLDCSGANQVVLNIIMGLSKGSVIAVISPCAGPMLLKMSNYCAIRISDKGECMFDVLTALQPYLVICNTIMGADVIVKLRDSFSLSINTIWILHEWWDNEMIEKNLRLRNIKSLSTLTVKRAFTAASHIVCVCQAQMDLYEIKPGRDGDSAASTIFVGVPCPITNLSPLPSPSCSSSKDKHNHKDNKSELTVFLSLGIVCPRKNQLWVVEQFKLFAGNRTDLRLLIVGARFTREYEADYVSLVKESIAFDRRIELYDVTEDVEQFYQRADIFILASLNEVTPLVLSEALSYSIPVISTNIAGITEMVENGVEGYLFDPGDTQACQAAMMSLCDDKDKRREMATAARCRYNVQFDLSIMINNYKRLIIKMAPPTILVDFFGVVMDFECSLLESAALTHSKGLLLNSPPVEGSIDALMSMKSEGFRVLLLVDPLLSHPYCLHESTQWVRAHLGGEEWVSSMIITTEKAIVSGDLFISSFPFDLKCPAGKYTTATWSCVLFSSSFNLVSTIAPRMYGWADWRKAVNYVLDKPRSC